MSFYNYEELKTFLNVAEVSKDIDEYIEWIEIASVSDARYAGQQEYSNHVMSFVHEKLKSVGFVNGNIEANKPKNNPLAALWFSIYQSISSPCYPLFDHHASTKEKQENDILKLKCIKNTLLGIQTEIGKVKGKIRKISDYSPHGTKNQIFCVWLATKEKTFFPA